jgi:hypothetical protein
MGWLAVHATEPNPVFTRCHIHVRALLVSDTSVQHWYCILFTLRGGTAKHRVASKLITTSTTTVFNPLLFCGQRGKCKWNICDLIIVFLLVLVPAFTRVFPARWFFSWSVRFVSQSKVKRISTFDSKLLVILWSLCWIPNYWSFSSPSALMPYCCATW